MTETHTGTDGTRGRSSFGAEKVLFQRRSDLPGVEVRTVVDSAGSFRSYSTGFEFMVPTTWRGEIWHRQRRGLIEPGCVLSAHPGEVFVGQRVLHGGAFSSLTIDAESVAAYAPPHLERSEFRLRRFTRMSEVLCSALFGVIQAVQERSPLGDVRARLSEFLVRMTNELVEERPEAPSLARPHALAVERVRERLHNDTSGSINLTALAKETGLSRFQALRAFKRRFGLPPHSYQLRVRLGLAQKSLRDGLLPAQVAAEFGFVDQSHLTRHFKRLVGVTPAEYARCGARVA